MSSKEITKTERTKVRRVPKRAVYEHQAIYEILDEAFVCHIGFTVDEKVFVIPTSYARQENNLLVHGSSASRMMRAMAWEKDVCVTITLVDGLVMARSAFHHSMNYRSVVIFGKAKPITQREEKLEALRLFSEHLAPGRWNDVRPPTENELKATMVLSLPLEEASAKIRTGDPIDDEQDYAMNVWAGVIPLSVAAGQPINDSRLKPEIDAPDYLLNYRR